MQTNGYTSTVIERGARRISINVPRRIGELPKVCSNSDMICFSHLRWDFVFQRPQHLLTRFAKHRRVFYFEEPQLTGTAEARLNISQRAERLFVVTPELPKDSANGALAQRRLLDQMIRTNAIKNFTLWYYTPMALAFSDHLHASHTIYDCMDELSAFKNAPKEILNFERRLFAKADHVFTGGYSLFEAKRTKHFNIHAFPSSIDPTHFRAARQACPEPDDLKKIPHPRLGFYGVLDERIDFELLEKLARRKPAWQIILVGPIAKIDPAKLPRRPNIHYLGAKAYTELPYYLAHWDIALLPFALNEATRFISPTKTPEYLAAGKPVVSTAIRDVVRPYGDEGLISVAGSAEEFVKACESILAQPPTRKWRDKVDRFLSLSSWDRTWKKMAGLELKGRRGS